MQAKKLEFTLAMSALCRFLPEKISHHCIKNQFEFSTNIAELKIFTFDIALFIKHNLFVTKIFIFTKFSLFATRTKEGFCKRAKILPVKNAF